MEAGWPAEAVTFAAPAHAELPVPPGTGLRKGSERRLPMASRAEIVTRFVVEAGPSWPWLEGKIRQLRGELARAQLEQMETLLQRFLAALESSFNDPGTFEHLSRLVEAMGRVCAPVATRERLEREASRLADSQDRRLRKDPLYSALRAHLFAVYERHPLLAFLVVVPPMEPQRDEDPRAHPLIEELRLVAQAQTAWADFRRRRAREPRARALLAAVEAICEGPYRQYLTLLWRLRAVQGVAPSAQAPVDLGRLVDDTVVEFPQFVDADAKFLRKAVAHRHTRYLPESDSVVLWNRNRRGETTDERTITVRDLASQAERLLCVGSLFPAGLRNAVVGEILIRGGVLRAMLDALGAHGHQPEGQVHEQLSAQIALALGLPKALPVG